VHNKIRERRRKLFTILSGSGGGIISPLGDGPWECVNRTPTVVEYRYNIYILTPTGFLFLFLFRYSVLHVCWPLLILAVTADFVVISRGAQCPIPEVHYNNYIHTIYGTAPRKMRWNSTETTVHAKYFDRFFCKIKSIILLYTYMARHTIYNTGIGNIYNLPNRTSFQDLKGRIKWIASHELPNLL